MLIKYPGYLKINRPENSATMPVKGWFFTMISGGHWPYCLCHCAALGHTCTMAKEVVDNYLTNVGSAVVEKDTKMDVLSRNFLRTL